MKSTIIMCAVVVCRFPAFKNCIVFSKTPQAQNHRMRCHDPSSWWSFVCVSHSFWIRSTMITMYLLHGRLWKYLDLQLPLSNDSILPRILHPLLYESLFSIQMALEIRMTPRRWTPNPALSILLARYVHIMCTVKNNTSSKLKATLPRCNHGQAASLRLCFLPLKRARHTCAVGAQMSTFTVYIASILYGQKQWKLKSGYPKAASRAFLFASPSHRALSPWERFT